MNYKCYKLTSMTILNFDLIMNIDDKEPDEFSVEEICRENIQNRKRMWTIVKDFEY